MAKTFAESIAKIKELQSKNVTEDELTAAVQEAVDARLVEVNTKLDQLVDALDGDDVETAKTIAGELKAATATETTGPDTAA